MTFAPKHGDQRALEAPRRILPDADDLRSLLSYDPDTGAMTWKERPVEMFNAGVRQKNAHAIWNSRYAGKPAFTAVLRGYHCGSVRDQAFVAHRVIWKMVHGTEPSLIDHINGNPLDNRLANLREASHLDNARNSKRPSTNTSGVMGVSRCKFTGLWEARVRGNGKRIFLGRFHDLDQAAAVRKEAEARLGFHENHGRG